MRKTECGITQKQASGTMVIFFAKFQNDVWTRRRGGSKCHPRHKRWRDAQEMASKGREENGEISIQKSPRDTFDPCPSSADAAVAEKERREKRSEFCYQRKHLLKKERKRERERDG